MMDGRWRNSSPIFLYMTNKIIPGQRWLFKGDFCHFVAEIVEMVDCAFYPEKWIICKMIISFKTDYYRVGSQHTLLGPNNEPFWKLLPNQNKQQC